MSSDEIVPSMRWVIRAAALLVLGAGAPLMLAPTRTEEFFVFPIAPALTATFIGSNYWAAAVIEAWSSTRRRWVEVRAAIPGILAFTALTAIVSILNAGQFDLASPFAWIWMAVYVLFPIVIVAAWWRQRRASGREHMEDRVEMPTGFRAVLGVVAIVLLGLGAGMVLYPAEAGAAWAWQLTTPEAAYRTAGGTSVEPYIGCWLTGIGLVVGGALFENDARRARPIFAGMCALGCLQVVSLVRFGGSIDWVRPQAWAFVAMIVMIAGAGVWGLSLRRGAR